MPKLQPARRNNVFKAILSSQPRRVLPKWMVDQFKQRKRKQSKYKSVFGQLTDITTSQIKQFFLTSAKKPEEHQEVFQIRDN